MSKITEQEVEDIQKAWGKGIVKIGKAYINGDDYKQAAINHIDTFYNYGEDRHGEVLFKPTLASVKQFRLDFEGALSYFIGENSNYPEDKGFALKPWINVGWENVGTKILGDSAIAMGNYYFTPKGKNPVPQKVEYSFAYVKVKGEIRIELHHSSLPYIPE